MGMSRVVQVEQEDRLVAHAGSDTWPLEFAADLPTTVAAARKRARSVWRDGFVGLADDMGHEEFALPSGSLKGEAAAAAAVRDRFVVAGVIPWERGWTFSTRCVSRPEAGPGDSLRLPLRP